MRTAKFSLIWERSGLIDFSVEVDYEESGSSEEDESRAANKVKTITWDIMANYNLNNIKKASHLTRHYNNIILVLQ